MTKMDSAIDWYNFWTKQNEIFFETANNHLATLFGKKESSDSTQYLELWFKQFKEQLEKTMQFDAPQQTYWKLMLKILNDAQALITEEWLKRAQAIRPISSIQELYDIWLVCCQNAYQNTMQSSALQNTYVEMMNNAFQYWEKNFVKDKV